MIAPAPIAKYREIIAATLPRLRQIYGVASLGIFGSRVRGDHRPDSDLDLLVSFDRAPGMLAYLSLEQELSDWTGKGDSHQIWASLMANDAWPG
jgi:predicted nucleotidyltransferase